jgi:hypothetical protein
MKAATLLCRCCIKLRQAALVRAHCISWAHPISITAAHATGVQAYKHPSITAARAVTQAHADHQTHASAPAPKHVQQHMQEAHAVNQSTQPAPRSITKLIPPPTSVPFFKAGTKTHLPNTSASVEPLSATLLPQ